MIRLAELADSDEIARLCRKYPFDGADLLTAYLSRCRDVHNIDWSYCDIWLGASESEKGKAQYLLCRLGNSYQLVGSPRSAARWEELHRFLALQPKGRLISEKEIIDEYERRFPSPLPKSVKRQEAARMVCACCPDIDCGGVNECESLWDIYDVLSSEVKELAQKVSRDEFTARLMFMKRGGARFFEIRNEGGPIAVGGILLPESGGFGKIIDICTVKEYRGCACASRITARLCREAFDLNKIPALDCADDSLVEFYSRLGFKPKSRWRKVGIYHEQKVVG